MTPILTNTTPGPYTAASGAVIAAFADISIDDPATYANGIVTGASGYLSIHLTGDPGATVSCVGDNDGVGTWDAATQTLTQFAGSGSQIPGDVAIDYILDHDMVNVGTAAATIDA